MSQWRPACSRELLVARAGLYRCIRDFFQSRGVLEVDTPLLAPAIGSDPNLHPLSAFYQAHPGAPAATCYLQTSPEFAMKRLLAAGSGPIYQLCKAFRNGELGRRHNPEFTMLEWYRPGFTLEQLMDEVEALVVAVLGPMNFRRQTYSELFLDWLQLEPHTASLDALQRLLRLHVEMDTPAPDRDTCLDLLYSHVIEPQLDGAVMIMDYPASQAALARVTSNAAGMPVARRFELVLNGMELTNGYDELCDAAEQRRRFARDLALRQERGLPVLPLDEALLGALEAGLPPCSGVALGVDRLLMSKAGVSSIEQVLAFPFRQSTSEQP